MNDLDKELKMTKIRHYEQMIKQSEMEIEKLREQLARDREQRKLEE